MNEPEKTSNEGSTVRLLGGIVLFLASLTTFTFVARYLIGVLIKVVSQAVK